MASPLASLIGFSLSGGTTQVLLGGAGALVKVPATGYVVVRNRGAALAEIRFLSSSDGGSNFYELPAPFWNDGIGAGVSPQPWPIPPPDERGEHLRVTGLSAGTTIDIEIYGPDLFRRVGGGLQRP